MNALIYAGVVVAGAITLLIEAYRNFNSSLSSVPFREHPILQNVEVEKLCTRRERNIGFLFYSLLYLVTYTVVLSSTSVLNLLIRASEENSQIGPRDQILTIDNDPFLLGGTDYGTPIFVSAAIIAIFSLGALRPVESTMRTLAHRLAGVPRGVYDAIERLHDIDYTTIPEGSARSFTMLFDKNHRQAFEDSTFAHHVHRLRSDLLAIDYLSPAIVGTRRLSYFPFTQLETMHELAEKMEERLDELRRRLEDQMLDEESLGKLATHINATFNDAVALFAVNFLRNNRSIKSIDNPLEPLSKVYEYIRRDYRVEMNSFAMAMLFSIVFGVIWASLEYSWWGSAARPLTDSEIRPAVEASLEAKAATLPDTFDARNEGNGSRSEIEACALLPGAGNQSYRDLVLPDDVVAQADVLNTRSNWMTRQFNMLFGGTRRDLAYDQTLGSFGPTCYQIWMAPAKKRMGTDRQNYFFGAFANVLPVAIGVMLAAVSTIFGRDVRREDNSWPDWEPRRPPFLRLASLALLPALLAVFGIVLGAFVIFWANTAFDPTEQQITNFFRSKANFFAMHLGTGFLIAFAVLFLTDNHLKLKVEPTLVIGLFFACLVFLWYVLVVIVGYPPEFLPPSPTGIGYSYELRETRIHAAQPVLFIFLYACFLELTEREEKESSWWIISRFQRAYGENGSPIFQRVREPAE